MPTRQKHPSVAIHFRVPASLYHQLDRLAGHQFQSVPAILRAAALEYCQRHRPKPGRRTGLSLTWQDAE